MHPVLKNRTGKPRALGIEKLKVSPLPTGVLGRW